MTMKISDNMRQYSSSKLIGNTCIILFFSLSFFCFYFSISNGLFVWLFPDELAAHSRLLSSNTLDCAVGYYLTTTVNRLSADLAVCSAAKIASLFSTPFKGWVFSRLCFYLLIPITMGFFLKEVIKLPFKIAFSSALFISAIAVYMLLQNKDVSYLFGLDLAIYALLLSTYFILCGLFIKSLTNKLYFGFFAIFYAVNLNTHEIALVLSAFFIPLFSWYRIHIYFRNKRKLSMMQMLKIIIHDYKIWVLSTIYLLSVLTVLLAPGMEMRHKVWPADGTFSDGCLYVLMNVEEIIFLIFKYKIMLIIVFYFGFILAFLNKTNSTYQYKQLILLIFLTPLLYLIVTAYLIGVTPSLWIGGLRTNSFRLIENVLNDPSLVILIHGGFAVRQNLFLYVSILLSILLGGFFTAERLQYYKNINKHKGKSLFCLLLIVSVVFLFFPNGYGSLRTLEYLFKKSYPEVLQELTTIKKYKSQNIVSHVFSNEYWDNINRILFASNYLDSSSGIANIIMDKYLKFSKNTLIDANSFRSVYHFLPKNYQVSKDPVWARQVHALYHVSIDKPCLFFSKNSTLVRCYKVVNKTEMNIVSKQIKDASLVKFYINIPQKVTVNNDQNSSQFIDTKEFSEHFITSKEVSVDKGLYYLTIDVKPEDTPLYVYIIETKGSILFPWLKIKKKGYSTTWNIMGKNNLTPILNQIEKTPDVERIKIVLNSRKISNLYIRLQHGDAKTFSTFYQGSLYNKTTIYNISFTKISETPIPKGMFDPDAY